MNSSQKQFFLISVDFIRHIRSILFLKSEVFRNEKILEAETHMQVSRNWFNDAGNYAGWNIFLVLAFLSAAFFRLPLSKRTPAMPPSISHVVLPFIRAPAANPRTTPKLLSGFLKRPSKVMRMHRIISALVITMGTD